MIKLADSPTEAWTPQTPEEIQAVRAQLDSLLSDPLFSQSRRYPSLLRRIVEDSLAGRVDALKERTLGIEIFNRTPDYDTNADAIVRVTAAEIRKRIALYYHGAQHASEVRIDLPVGGYVALFRPAVSKAEAPEQEIHSFTQASRPILEPAPIAKTRKNQPRTIAAMAALLAILIGLGAWFRPLDTFQQFWRPLTHATSPTLICVGQLPIELLQPQATSDALGRALLAQKPVSISDTIVVSTFATFLGAQGMKPRISVSTQTSYPDLRNSPVLLVGGLDNSWTMRLLGGLRYRMKSEPKSPLVRIYNAEKPDQENWTLDFGAVAKNVSEDYAIVARFHDRETEDTVIVAAGLGENGTSAAADFLTHPQYLEALGEAAPKNWTAMNVEAVIETEVIDGKAGPAKVVAKYFW